MVLGPNPLVITFGCGKVEEWAVLHGSSGERIERTVASPCPRMHVRRYVHDYGEVYYG